MLRILLFVTFIAATGPLGAAPKDVGKWRRQDLRFLPDRLPTTHVDAFHAVSRGDWESERRQAGRKEPSK